jgi:transcriptional regulator NrdR family protein
MICPNCGSQNVYVTDSRQVSNGKRIRRRRKCADCGHRFSSLEFALDQLIEVNLGDKTIYILPAL